MIMISITLYCSF